MCLESKKVFNKKPLELKLVIKKHKILFFLGSFNTYMIFFHSKGINKNEIAKISKTVIIARKQKKARHIKRSIIL